VPEFYHANGGVAGWLARANAMGRGRTS
jgi:hypothetical protein